VPGATAGSDPDTTRTSVILVPFVPAETRLLVSVVPVADVSWAHATNGVWASAGVPDIAMDYPPSGAPSGAPSVPDVVVGGTE